MSRETRLARLRIGVGGYLIAMAIVAVVVLARFPAWDLGTIAVTVAVCGGSGSLLLVGGVRRLRVAQHAIEAAKPVELPEARIVRD